MAVTFFLVEVVGAEVVVPYQHRWKWAFL